MEELESNEIEFTGIIGPKEVIQFQTMLEQLSEKLTKALIVPNEFLE